MATDNILRSYGDSSVREDVVLNAVEILTAQENWFLVNLGKSTAINTIHNYLVDTLDTVSANLYTVEESAAFTSRTLQTPTRLTNIVEIIAHQNDDAVIGGNRLTPRFLARFGLAQQNVFGGNVRKTDAF